MADLHRLQSGYQTSRYNRFVTVFVALGSFVSIVAIILSFQSTADQHPRPMDTVQALSALPSASRVGMTTLTFHSRESLATAAKQPMRLRLRMDFSARVVQWGLSLSCGLPNVMGESSTSS